jgi:hypothetical protein
VAVRKRPGPAALGLFAHPSAFLSHQALRGGFRALAPSPPRCRIPLSKGTLSQGHRSGAIPYWPVLCEGRPRVAGGGSSGTLDQQAR